MEKEKAAHNIETHSDTDLSVIIVLTIFLLAFSGSSGSNITEIEKELSELKGRTDVIEKLITNG